MSHSVNVGYLPDRGRLGLWIFNKPADGVGPLYQLTENGAVEHHPGEHRSPSCEIDDGAARMLMTRLWAEGVRPDGWSHEQTTEALRKHLEDVQATLDIERARFDTLLHRTLNP